MWILEGHNIFQPDKCINICGAGSFQAVYGFIFLLSLQMRPENCLNPDALWVYWLFETSTLRDWVKPQLLGISAVISNID